MDLNECVCTRVRVRGRPSQLVARSDRALSAITAPGVSTTTINDNVVVAVATNTLVPLHLHREEGGTRGKERARFWGRRGWGGGRQAVGDEEGRVLGGFQRRDISTKLWHAGQSGLYVHVAIMHSDVSMDDGRRTLLLLPTFITVIGASRSPHARMQGAGWRGWGLWGVI